MPSLDSRVGDLERAVRGLRGGIDGIKTKAELERFIRHRILRPHKSYEPSRFVASDDDVSFAGGWVDTGPALPAPVGFYLDDAAFVQIFGKIYHLGAISGASKLFTLPTGYRPTATAWFPAHIDAEFGANPEVDFVPVKVEPNGDVTVVVPGAGTTELEISLDAVRFRTV